MSDNQFQAAKKIVDRAYQLKKEKKYQEARTLLEEGRQEHPDNRYIKTSLADLFIYLNQYEEARSLADEVLADKPDDNRALTVKGTIAYKKKDYQQALDFFQQAYAAKKDKFVVHRLIKTYRKLGRFKEGLELCREWLEKKPDDPYLLKDKAGLLQKMGETKQACKIYDQYLEMKPDDEFAYKEYIKLKVAGKNPEEAAKELRQLLKVGRRGKNVHLHSLLAQKLEEAEEFKEAAEEYKRALKLKPGDKFVLHRLGRSLLEMGEEEEGLDYLKKAFRQDPSDYYIRSSLLYLFKKLEGYEEGIEYFKEIIQNNSGFNNLWGMIKKLNKAREEAESSESETD